MLDSSKVVYFRELFLQVDLKFGQNNCLPNTLQHCKFQFSMLSCSKFWFFDVIIIPCSVLSAIGFYPFNYNILTIQKARSLNVNQSSNTIFSQL